MESLSPTLLKKEHLTKNVYALSFSKPNGFTFAAGQFVQFLIPDGEKSVPRAYSLSSSQQDEELLFCVKYLDKGKASEYFDQMHIGDTLEMRGPRGNFSIKEEIRSVDLIATGTGIAPMMGILRDELVHKKSNTNFHLLFGLRSEEDVFWKAEFEQLAKEHENFRVDYTLSQPKSDDWDGLTGRVTAHVEPKANTHYFLCGSAPMVKDVRAKLLEAKVEKSMIHFEIF